MINTMCLIGELKFGAAVEGVDGVTAGVGGTKVVGVDPGDGAPDPTPVRAGDGGATRTSG
jgi:hypothetical protein